MNARTKRTYFSLELRQYNVRHFTTFQHFSLDEAQPVFPLCLLYQHRKMTVLKILLRGSDFG